MRCRLHELTVRFHFKGRKSRDTGTTVATRMLISGPGHVPTEGLGVNSLYSTNYLIFNTDSFAIHWDDPWMGTLLTVLFTRICSPVYTHLRYCLHESTVRLALQCNTQDVLSTQFYSTIYTLLQNCSHLSAVLYVHQCCLHSFTVWYTHMPAHTH